MRLCIAGASGFIGRHLAAAAAAHGHEVVCAARSAAPGCARSFALDFSAPAPETWGRELSRVDVLVNTVGILRESGPQTFDALHVRGPRALFNAAASAGVRRIIQVSALGADAEAPARYHSSKHQADRHLMGLRLDWAVVQPSLVYGAGGTSAALFDTLANLPLIPVPGDGRQQVQPVHIDDLVAALLRLVESPDELRRVIPAVGPRALTLAEFLLELRQAQGLPPTKVLRVPRGLIVVSARIGDRLPSPLLDSETFGMLERGNTAPVAEFQTLLGHPPRSVRDFISGDERKARRYSAALGWLAPLLRVSLAAVWFIAGITSLGLYPIEDSLELLRRIGAPPALAPVLLFGAAVLDLLLGVLTLLPRRPRHLWNAQLLLVAVYTLIITLLLPHLWLEPFGPVAKNLPIMAIILLLRRLEEPR